MKRLFAVFSSALLLLAISACSPTTSNPPNVRTVTMTRLGTSNPSATGVVTVEKLSTGGLKTNVSVQGLTPNTVYALHYHAMGAASTDPCLSNGAIKTDLPDLTTDASGNGSIIYTASTGNLADLGVYVNVHIKSDLTVVPLCGNVSSVAF